MRFEWASRCPKEIASGAVMRIMIWQLCKRRILAEKAMFNIKCKNVVGRSCPWRFTWCHGQQAFLSGQNSRFFRYIWYATRCTTGVVTKELHVSWLLERLETWGWSDFVAHERRFWSIRSWPVSFRLPRQVNKAKFGLGHLTADQYFWLK